MKLTESKLRDIINEEIIAEEINNHVEENENLEEGFFSTIAGLGLAYWLIKAFLGKSIAKQIKEDPELRSAVDQGNQEIQDAMNQVSSPESRKRLKDDVSGLLSDIAGVIRDRLG